MKLSAFCLPPTPPAGFPCLPGIRLWEGDGKALGRCPSQIQQHFPPKSSTPSQSLAPGHCQNPPISFPKPAVRDLFFLHRVGNLTYLPLERLLGWCRSPNTFSKPHLIPKAPHSQSPALGQGVRASFPWETPRSASALKSSTLFTCL